MKLKKYIKANEIRLNAAERHATWRLKRAANETMKPIIEAAKFGQLRSQDQADTLIKGDAIEKVLRWIYIDWAYQQGLWTRRVLNLKEQKSDVFNQRLENLFNLYGADKVKQIVGTTKGLAKGVIRNALNAANQGVSIDVIQEGIQTDIRAAGGVMSDARARAIARTEVIGASNRANFEVVAGEGLELEKKWQTGGLNIRDTHTAAENEGWVEMNHIYQIGKARMMHPVDPDVHSNPEEVVNCKCTLLFRVKGLGLLN
jgi:hypothetical protein